MGRRFKESTVETARCPLKSVSPPPIAIEVYVRLGAIIPPSLLCGLPRPRDQVPSGGMCREVMGATSAYLA